jgi:1-aminocyclopropane-1-carboxylate deaminase/D-cysteine desulfhydrase-like pyridoxal-dependent ACC family enzyme
VRAALEIHEQALDLGIPDAVLLVAAGSGGTLAGLLAGLALLDSSLCVIGIDVGKLWKAFPTSIARLANEIIARLDPKSKRQIFTAQNVPLVEERFVGAGYGKPSPAGLAAIRLAAQLEGILLDPVYTAKAFAGLLAACQSPKVEPEAWGHVKLERDQPVIFLHTGGIPALFAFQESQLTS